MTLSSNVNALATAVADEFNTVRTEIPEATSSFPQPVGTANTVGTSEDFARADHIHRLSTGDRALLDSVSGKANASHTHTINDITVRQGTTATSINADSIDVVDLAMSADATLAVPTNGYNGKVIQVSGTASAAVTLTFNGSYLRLNGIESSYDIPSGSIFRASVRRTGTSWIVEAVGVTQ